jgi:hypothetical protein
MRINRAVRRERMKSIEGSRKERESEEAEWDRERESE